jgi:hypothetical protein
LSGWSNRRVLTMRYRFAVIGSESNCTMSH